MSADGVTAGTTGTTGEGTRLRVVFTEPQRWGPVEADRLSITATRVVFVDANGNTALDVPAETIQSVNQGAEARTARLRERAPRHGRAWTEPERVVLRELLAAGADMAEMTQQTGRSANAVRSEIKRLESGAGGGNGG
ncbi:hypothetical protein [Actinomadura parmotrematis]|uniref:Helix-turn-helix domain-containing protein n=1 Tax=Actinomadura parmotrematis TaxID=2864039 RepID=A0ABS7G506_9ACTN|nr:hypothetical protein [Actinomadura parmotrematis]MBW8486713.1 hypothetical protein [Actinomadura parmotrematis]